MNDQHPHSAERQGGELTAHRDSGREKPIEYILVGIFILLALGFIYLARDFLLPISIAFVLSLVLSPVVRWLARHGIPAPATAAAVVVILLIGFSTIGYLLSGPIASVVEDAPRISDEIQKKFAVLQRPLQAISQATTEIEEIVKPTEDADRVVVEEGRGFAIGYLATDAGQRLASIGLSLVLLLFILASGDLFQQKLIKVLPTLTDKKRGLRIARSIEHEVSRYLFTVTFINCCLGIAVGTVFWILGMPSPVLWGIAATLANYLPYIGPAIILISALGIGIVALDTIAQGMLAPGIFLLMTITEGQIITPMILGQRHAMNAVVILISIAFWGWIWGIVGALIAVPLLVTAKVFAEHIDGLKPVGEFLGARDTPLAQLNHEHADPDGHTQ